MAELRCLQCGRRVRGTILSVCPDCGSDVEVVPEDERAPSASSLRPAAPIELDEPVDAGPQPKWDGLTVEIEEDEPEPVEPPPAPETPTQKTEDVVEHIELSVAAPTEAQEPQIPIEAEDAPADPPWISDGPVLMASLDDLQVREPVREPEPLIVVFGDEPLPLAQPSPPGPVELGKAHAPLAPSEVEEELQRASTMIALGLDDLAPAIDRCRRVLAYDPRNRQALALLADACERSLLLDQAEEACASFLALEPANGRISEQLQRIREAKSLRASAPPEPASWRAAEIRGSGTPAPLEPPEREWKPRDDDEGDAPISPFALAALAGLLCCPFLSIVLGAIAWTHTRSGKARGGKLAIASVAIGVVLTIVWLVGLSKLGALREHGARVLDPMEAYEELLEDQTNGGPQSGAQPQPSTAPMGSNMRGMPPMGGPGGMGGPPGPSPPTGPPQPRTQRLPRYR